MFVRELSCVRKLNYLHANPVIRRLVKHPKDWPWSSWSNYAKNGRNDCGGCDVGGRVREENPGPTLTTQGWGTLRVLRIADQGRESEDGPPAISM